MKINKKIFIPILTTAMGLSVIGGIAGAVAWYQYNSRVTTSFAGASVADTGVLQIGSYQPVFDEQGQPVMETVGTEQRQKEEIVWGRDLVHPNINRLVPVTFGAMNEVQDPVLDEHNLPVDADGDGQNDVITRYLLPNKAYAYPEAGCGEGYEGHHDYTDAYGKHYDIDGWVEAEEGKDYYQFEFYMRAVQIEDDQYVQVVRDVFLSDYINRSIDGDPKFAHDALRIHIAANDGADGAVLLSNNEYKDENVPGSASPVASLDKRLPLYGPLDLDRSNHADADPNADELDVYHASIWNDGLKAYGVHPDTYGEETFPSTDPSAAAEQMAGAYYRDGEVINYGVYGAKQTTKSFANAKQARDANGMMPRLGSEEYYNKLFTLSDDVDHPTKITVTIWLEGWEPLTNDGTNSEASKSALWNPEYTVDASLQIGLQFDTGIFRGDDLTELAPANNNANPSNPDPSNP